MNVVWLLVGFLLLVLGAEGLVRGAVSLALRAQIPPLVVGLTIVALGTSAPELVVSLRSALEGRDDVSVGNIVGSNICNVGLILGLAAILRPLRVKLQLVRIELPALIGVSLLLTGLLIGGTLSRPEGLLLLTGGALYLWLQVRLARRGPAADVDVAPPPPAPGRPQRHPWLDALLVLGGIAVLVFGAGRFIAGAVGIARALGVSEAVIGLTLVAVGTSLPELATSAVAAVRGQGDVAIGNVVGSNLLNVLLILGATAAISPLRSTGIGASDLAAMTAFAVLLLPLLRTGFALSRREGVILLVLYGLYVLQLAVSF